MLEASYWCLRGTLLLLTAALFKRVKVRLVLDPFSQKNLKGYTIGCENRFTPIGGAGFVPEKLLAISGADPRETPANDQRPHLRPQALRKSLII